jgi:hypothetical protein
MLHCRFLLFAWLLLIGCDGKRDQLNEELWKASNFVDTEEGLNDLKDLIQKGADPNSRYFEGRTALMNAVSVRPTKYSADAVRCLLVAGADPNATDDGGDSVLVLLLSRSTADDSPPTTSPATIDVITSLLAKADPNRARPDGITPLMQAVDSGNIDVVAALLKARADPNRSDRTGTTALMRSAFGPNFAQIGQLLIEAGANPQLKDNNGRTANDIASARRAESEVNERVAAETRAQVVPPNEFVSECKAGHLSLRRYSNVAVWIIDDFATPTFPRNIYRSPLAGMAHGEIIRTIVQFYFHGPVFTTNVRGSVSDEHLNGGDLLQGLDSVISFAAENPDTAVVVNMSWGTASHDEELEEFFSTVSSCGVVFVASAGNEDLEQCSYPASYRGVIAVGSVEGNTGVRAHYSNWGSCVQVAVREDASVLHMDIAPYDTSEEVEIVQEARLLGTSFAAAHVTAAIAQMISKDPTHSLLAPVPGLIHYSALSGTLHGHARGFENSIWILDAKTCPMGEGVDLAPSVQVDSQSIGRSPCS